MNGEMQAGALQFVSGERQQAMRDEFERRYALAVRHGQHLWIAALQYFVDPAKLADGEQLLLDAENLASDPAVGCYVCEQVFTKRLDTRRCPGEPKDDRGWR